MMEGVNDGIRRVTASTVSSGDGFYYLDMVKYIDFQKNCINKQ